MNNNNQIEQKLAGSLTAETTELLPYLPYLLQDIWELGSNPRDMAGLIKDNIKISSKTRIIDLGCGKGAVSISLCKELGIRAKGIDLLPEFIKEAGAKAREYGVEHLCEFTIHDINESVKAEQGYDIVILGAVVDVLGEPAETLNKLKVVVHRNGYILINEGYLLGDQDDVRYQNYEYLTLGQWEQLFQELDLEVIAFLTDEDNKSASGINDYNNKMIRKRADELIFKYPEKQEIFEGYVKSQQMECDDLNNTVVGVTWLLKQV